MNCKAIRHKLSAYLDGELAGFEMLEIRSHLHRCHACEQEYEELRRLKWLMSRIPERDPDPEFAHRLKSKVLQPSGVKPVRVSVAMISGLAFAAALLVSLATLHNRRGPVPAPSTTTEASSSTSFDLARDQAYQNGGDSFSDSPPVITAASSYNDSH